MTDKEKLAIYDQLREAHRYISVINRDGMEEEHQCALGAVDLVLYLAEAHFARMDP